MKTLFEKLRDFLHSRPALRKGARWIRWQTKKIPFVAKLSIAFDRAYFKMAGNERRTDNDYGGSDEYFDAYAGFILPRVHGEVLDVGCGHGYLTQKIAEQKNVSRVVGIDKTSEFLCTHPKIHYITQDITGTDAFPGKFDVVVSSEFVEHISEGDHEKMLIKVASALKEGGVYVGSTPRNPTNYATFSGSRFHVREYNERDLRRILEQFFGEVSVVPLSEYCLGWEARKPMTHGGKVKLHLGCGEKYLEGYVNIDFPDAEHTVMHPKVDLYADIRTLSYPEDSVDEVRSHHLFEHFTRAEALKLLVRWRSWLKPGGTLTIETPDFAGSAALFVSTFSMRRKFQLARHMIGSEEAGWAIHKDYWDKEKFNFVLKKMGFRDIKIRCYQNGLARHAEKIPVIDKMLRRIPEPAYIPILNAFGTMLPERFYKKFGSHKLPNILASAKKDDRVIDTAKIAREILALSLAGREDHRLLDVWYEDFKNF